MVIWRNTPISVCWRMRDGCWLSKHMMEAYWRLRFLSYSWMKIKLNSSLRIIKRYLIHPIISKNLPFIRSKIFSLIKIMDLWVRSCFQLTFKGFRNLWSIKISWANSKISPNRLKMFHQMNRLKKIQRKRPKNHNLHQLRLINKDKSRMLKIIKLLKLDKNYGIAGTSLNLISIQNMNHSYMCCMNKLSGQERNHLRREKAPNWQARWFMDGKIQSKFTKWTY